MELNPIGLALPNSQISEAANSAAQLADTFDTFLTLLTQQLQNQDPLDPMDSQQFVSQLVEFSSVEQQIQQNDSLETLLALQAATATSTAVDYVGREVTASTNSNVLTNRQASWTYGLEREADSTQIMIFNEQGRLVRTIEGQTGAGPHTLQWDGTDEFGNLQPDGVYSLEIASRDANGVEVFVPVRVSGRATGIDMAGGEVTVEMGGLRVPATQIVAVREVPPAG